MIKTQLAIISDTNFWTRINIRKLQLGFSVQEKFVISISSWEVCRINQLVNLLSYTNSNRFQLQSQVNLWKWTKICLFCISKIKFIMLWALWAHTKLADMKRNKNKQKIPRIRPRSFTAASSTALQFYASYIFVFFNIWTNVCVCVYSVVQSDANQKH